MKKTISQALIYCPIGIIGGSISKYLETKDMTIEMYITIGFSILIILILFLGFRIFSKIEKIELKILKNKKITFCINNHAKHIIFLLKNTMYKEIPYIKVSHLLRKKETDELIMVDEITYKNQKKNK